MIYVFLVAFLCLLALSLPYIWRVIVGPTVFDRVVALNALGTKVPLLLILVGLMYERVDMFVDIALGLFLLNLVTTLLLAKHVREKGGV